MSYPLHQSPLYKAYSLMHVAAILRPNPRRRPTHASAQMVDFTAGELESLANAGMSGYALKTIADSKGKSRQIQTPQADLKFIHRRLKALLERIETPDYLFSATKTRSYVDNARRHANGQKLMRIDLQNFFASTSAGYIYDFFRHRLNCEKHVATVLTKLCSVDGYLPAGSPLSPLLSFFAHQKLFDDIASLCTARGCRMSLYSDDICISGANAKPELLWQVKKRIHRHGLHYHKTKQYGELAAKRVTGVIVVGAEVRLRNRMHQQLHDGFTRLGQTREPMAQLQLIRSLLRQLHDAQQIDPKFTGKIEYLQNLRRSIGRSLARTKFS